MREKMFWEFIFLLFTVLVVFFILLICGMMFSIMTRLMVHPDTIVIGSAVASVIMVALYYFLIKGK